MGPLLLCLAAMWLSATDAFAPASMLLRAVLPRAGSCRLRMALANQDVPMAPVLCLSLLCGDSALWPERICKCLMTLVHAQDVRSLESSSPPLPHRTATKAGYRAPDLARTWTPFVYSSAVERRAKAAEVASGILERSLAAQEVEQTPA